MSEQIHSSAMRPPAILSSPATMSSIGRDSTAMSIDGNALPDASAYHVRVALRELSRREILQAVAEYDRLGQDRFLEKYGFGAARSYRLVVDGKTYDSKAIVGAAHGFLPGQEPLTAQTSAAGRRPSDAC